MKKNTYGIQNGLLNRSLFKASPNRSVRPKLKDIRLIVIHNISLPPEQFDNHHIDDFFLNKLDPKAHPYFEKICHLQVSAHLLIRRDGTITQFVPFDERAWHAGVSTFKGTENCNDFSIGIELEGTDQLAYTEEQYIELSRCCRSLIEKYPLITTDNITGHSDIAPGRKTDPGESFDWEKFRALL